jgi:hypothetical protein
MAQSSGLNRNRQTRAGTPRSEAADASLPSVGVL